MDTIYRGRAQQQRDSSLTELLPRPRRPSYVHLASTPGPFPSLLPFLSPLFPSPSLLPSRSLSSPLLFGPSHCLPLSVHSTNRPRAKQTYGVLTLNKLSDFVIGLPAVRPPSHPPSLPGHGHGDVEKLLFGGALRADTVLLLSSFARVRYALYRISSKPHVNQTRAPRITRNIKSRRRTRTLMCKPRVTHVLVSHSHTRVGKRCALVVCKKRRCSGRFYTAELGE